ncbi:MAG: ADP-ribosylglycohydrolase family protein [Chthoniobacterales bacterium]
MTHSNSSSGIADRAAGCIVGAFIGDALGVGAHWYYDLDEMRKDYGPWIDGYTTPKKGRYHEGLKPGDSSQSGIIMEMLLSSVAEKGGYEEKDFCDRLDKDLFPHLDGKANHGPGGFTNHSIRQAWRARVKEGKPWSEAGGNVDTSEGAERISIIAARYAKDIWKVADLGKRCCELAQKDSRVVQQSVAFALVLALLIRGEPFDEHLSDKLIALEDSGEVPFVSGSSIASIKSAHPAMGFASPDALLLPTWIATAVKDKGTRIDPAWKVSLVYGMSCAINFVLPCAYYLSAMFPDDFESAVLHAINGGGQNMSRACLTGALVGAQCGLSKIPQRFIDGLTHKDKILEMAKKIAAGA